jgi:hypothetical protein
VIGVATKPGNQLATEWVPKLLQGRPRKLAALALPNEVARIAWIKMTSGSTYRHPSVVDAVSA